MADPQTQTPQRGTLLMLYVGFCVGVMVAAVWMIVALLIWGSDA